MEAKEVISAAKSYIADVFQDEGVFNIGLEEIEFKGNHWEVTIGFSRKWDLPPSNPLSISIGSSIDLRNLTRTYKVVEIDDFDGKIKGVKNRTGLA